MSAGDRRLRLGILGAGMIATAPWGFLPNLSKLRDRIEIVAIASRTVGKAREVAEQFSIAHVYPDLGAMLGGAQLDAIVNLTPIPAHYETSIQIIEAGKHLVTEKPIATTMSQVNDICAAAERRGVLVVAAPFDMLSRDWRTAKRLVADGAIGRPAFARVHSSHGGPALMGWPVDPTWFYQEGAGPLFDLGVYGLHRITGILGPACRVSAFSGITNPVRRARGGPFDGLEIEVREPDNTLMLLDFGGALFASVDATFNVAATRSPLLELYGDAGTLLVHSPSADPTLEIFRLDAAPGLPGWITPTPIGFPDSPDRAAALQRGVLVEHLADCLERHEQPVASADHARHVLEIILAARRSASLGRVVDLTTTFVPPAPGPSKA